MREKRNDVDAEFQHDMQASILSVHKCFDRLYEFLKTWLAVKFFYRRNLRYLDATIELYVRPM